jgi:hypothetical protein
MKWGFRSHLVLGALLWAFLAVVQYKQHRLIVSVYDPCFSDVAILPSTIIPSLPYCWNPEPTDDWVICLLMLAPLVLIPLAWRFGMEGERDRWQQGESLCMLLLAASWTIRGSGHWMPHAPEKLYSIFCATPWLLLQTRQALIVFARWRYLGLPSLHQGCIDSTRIFPCIGSGWLLAFLADWTPWNFDPLIVLLTAAHFHHAGFTLPLMAGLNAKASPGCWTRFSCVAILAGVPLVAAGITCTHFGVLRFVEPFGVTVLVLGALGVAVSQIRRGMEKQHSMLTRIGFVVSGASLLSAMILAMGFGLRHVVPNWALTMPQMWMIHGTLNAFGFGLCGLLAWRAGPESVRTKVA